MYLSYCVLCFLAQAHVDTYILCLPSFIFTDITVDQRICNIYSPSLTTNGGVMSIPSGTQNVILYCICRRNNVAVGPGTWLINGTRVTRTIDDGSGNPYSRDNVPAPLIIPSFTATHVGTYTCTSDGDTVTTSNVTINAAQPSMHNYDTVAYMDGR